MTDFFKETGRMALETPLWEWCLFGYFIIVGVNALKTRNLFWPKLFIIPTILIGLKVEVFHLYPRIIMLIYLILLFLGTLLGTFVFSRIRIEVERRFFLKIPGTYQLIVLLMFFFAAKYIFGYLRLADPGMEQHYWGLEFGISGGFTGYFLGRTTSFLKQYFRKIKNRS